MEKIKTNLNKMLLDRRYIHFENLEDEKMVYKNENDKKILIIFYNIKNEKVGVDYVKRIIEMTEEMDIEHIILVTCDKLTPFANKHILNHTLKIEVFLFEELKFNVTEHELVPRHTLLSIDESQKVIEKYGRRYLPQIKKTDIISRYFDAELGQIMMIHRNEGGISYRLVVN